MYCIVLYIQYRGTILPPRAGRRWRGAPLDLEISSSRRAHRLRVLAPSLLSHFRQLKAEEEMNNVVVTKVKRWTPPTRVVSTPRSRRRRKQTCGSVFHLTRQRSNVATSPSGPPSEPERPDLATELQYSHGLVWLGEFRQTLAESTNEQAVRQFQQGLRRKAMAHTHQVSTPMIFDSKRAPKSQTRPGCQPGLARAPSWTLRACLDRLNRLALSGHARGQT